MNLLQRIFKHLRISGIFKEYQDSISEAAIAKETIKLAETVVHKENSNTTYCGNPYDYNRGKSEYEEFKKAG
ncbi:MAG: hypothetical protein ACJAT2_002176 [Bacteriovoracaceae bacterium]|jgi:hypothetical protein